MIVKKMRLAWVHSQYAKVVPVVVRTIMSPVVMVCGALIKLRGLSNFLYLEIVVHLSLPNAFIPWNRSV